MGFEAKSTSEGPKQSVDFAVGPTEDITVADRDLELEHALNRYVPNTDAEKRFVRKLDMYIMPTLWFMYILAYIDRQNIVSEWIHCDGEV